SIRAGATTSVAPEPSAGRVVVNSIGRPAATAIRAASVAAAATESLSGIGTKSLGRLRPAVNGIPPLAVNREVRHARDPGERRKHDLRRVEEQEALARRDRRDRVADRIRGDRDLRPDLDAV